MSGLEILGAAAAAEQLAQVLYKLVVALADLRKKVHDAPDEFSDRKTQLEQLIELAKSVKDSPAVNSSSVVSVLRSILAKARKALRVLAETEPSENPRTVGRYWKALTRGRKEKDFLGILAKIHDEKSTLALCIANANTNLLETIQSSLDQLKLQPSQSVAPDLSLISAPSARNPNFTGREALLDQLQEILDRNANRVALYGLGGVGKSSILLELMHRLRENEPPHAVFWLSAANMQAFESSYKNLAAGLGINVSQGLQSIKTNLNRYFATCTSNWLLGLDNADDEDLFFGSQRMDENTDAIFDYLPQSLHCSIVITTRDKKLAMKFADPEVVEVPVMDESEASETFSKIIRKELVDDETRQSQLIEMMDCLPLAIGQAAAYMNENGVSVSEYLQLFAENDDSKLHLLSNDVLDKTQSFARRISVARTWIISFQKLKRDDPQAADFLSLLSCFEQQRIPKKLLPPASSAAKAVSALGTLKAYAFITVSETGQLISLHRLVRLATRNWLAANDKLQGFMQQAVSRLLVFVQGESCHDMRAQFECLPYVKDIVDSKFLPQDMVTQSRVKNLLLCSAESFGLLEHKATAQTFARRALMLCESLHRPDHPETFICQRTLGFFIFELEDDAKSAESKNLMHRALDGQRQCLGDEHRETLKTQMTSISLEVTRNMPAIYDDALSRLLEIKNVLELTMVPKDPLIGDCMMKIGAVYAAEGKIEEAIGSYRDALIISNESLNRLHPQIIAVYETIAFLARETSDSKFSEDLLREASARRRELFGIDNHPTNMMRLVRVASRQKNLEEAESLLREADALVCHVSGMEFQLTVILDLLAVLLKAQGKIDELLDVLRRVLELNEGRLGLESNKTFKTMFKIDICLVKLNKFEEAEDMWRRFLDTGTDLQFQGLSVRILASYYLGFSVFEQGRIEEAEKHFTASLELLIKDKGEEPAKLEEMYTSNLAQLALIRYKQGRIEDEMNTRRRLLEAHRLLGITNGKPALDNMYCLARGFEDKELYEEALRLFELCLEGDLEDSVSGPSSLATIQTMERCAIVSVKLDRLDGGKEFCQRAQESILLHKLQYEHGEPIDPEVSRIEASINEGLRVILKEQERRC